MSLPTTAAPNPTKPLRLWPGVTLVVLQWLLRFVVPVVDPEALGIGIFGALIAGALVLIWWAFFSRAPHWERWGAIGLAVAALFVTSKLVHRSIATGGMGYLFPILALPIVCLTFVAAVAISRRFSVGARRATIAVGILLGAFPLTLIKTGGVTGDFDQDLAWRWAKTHEDRLLEEAGPAALPPSPPPAVAVAPPTAAPAAPPTEPSAAPAVVAEADSQPALADPAPSEAVTTAASEPAVEPVAEPVADTAAEPAVAWPGFRGPERNGIVSGVELATDWVGSPPVELWRRPIGPGWSSFAVAGDRLYTQEQRGDEEVVSCYDAATGEPVWAHRDVARFWESNAGAGPRATPTLANGRVYTLGGTGIVNVLDARDGRRIWSRNAVTDAAVANPAVKVPYWGISGSPLVLGSLVLVPASGTLVAYEAATGEVRWIGPAGGPSYASPHFATIDGVPQVLMLSEIGTTSFDPADGKVLWQHAWDGYPMVQPAMTADGDVLVTSNQPNGVRRLAVSRQNGAWTVAERWTSIKLKPYFNDFVVHEGHAYGLDGAILAAIELAGGERSWKGGRYGGGQVLLLPEQDLLLVLGEKGELALVRATPERFQELARVQALTGKTWNHPVLVGDLLLVRNAEEMAAFRLARRAD